VIKRLVAGASRSLRARILVATLALLAVALGVAVIGFERSARTVILASVRAHLEARAQEAQDGLARFQRERALAVQNWADADSMQLTIESGDPKFAEDYLRRTVQDQYGAIEYAALLAPDGWMLAAVRYATTGPRAFQFESLRGVFVDMKPLAAARQGADRTAVVLPLTAIVPDSPPLPRVVLASPVKDFLGEVVGVLVVTVGEDALSRTLGDLSGPQPEYHPAAYAAAGRIVLSGRPEEAHLARSFLVPGATSDGLERLVPEGGRPLLAARSRGAEGVPGWTAVMSVDEAFALGHLHNLRLLLGAMWAVVLGVAVLVSGVALRKAARPLSDVSQSMTKVASGDLSTRLPDGWTGELGTLVRSFNTMVSEVQRSREELSRTEAARRELAIAQQIQTAILPVSPQVAGFEIAARMKPADDVGGDLFDVLDFGDTFWVLVGDVSGHGLNSGLVMMMAQAAASAAIADSPRCSPRDVIAAVNGVVYENVRRRMGRDDYLTLMAARHVGGGKFVAAGAHQPVFIARRGGQVDVVEPVGSWCGISPRVGAITKEYEFEVGPGETMCLITDGVVESRSDAHELFGEDRLRMVLSAGAGEGAPASQSLAEVFAAVERFSSVQADDVTAILLRRDDAN
jgi:sigma-B regulation protein RsbU (phosphoserine phosphatase)